MYLKKPVSSKNIFYLRNSARLQKWSMTLRSLGQYLNVLPSSCFGKDTPVLLQNALLALSWSPKSLNSNPQNYCFSYHHFNNVMRHPNHEVSSDAATLHSCLLNRQEDETMNPGGY